MPEELEGALLAKYAIKLQAGERLALNELRTPVFNMFCDVDWRTAEPVPEPLQLELATFLAKQVFLVWEVEEAVEAVACVRDASREADGRHKGGIHLHWSHVKTEAAAAAAWRKVAVERCSEHFGERRLEAPWDQVLDEHVYATSGLRMLYSCKRDGPEAYRPRWVVRMTPEPVGGLQEVAAEVTDCADDPPTWIPRCSIRYHGHCVTKVQECMAGVVGARAPRARADEEDMAPYSEGLEALRQVLPVCYAGCKFLKLLRGQTGRFILRTDSRTCLNLDTPDGQPGQHKSNGVYFVVGPSTVYQGCHCRCNTTQGRLMGRCSEFQSNHFPTPRPLALALFGSPPSPKPAARPYAFAAPATAADIYRASLQPPAKKARRRK